MCRLSPLLEMERADLSDIVWTPPEQMKRGSALLAFAMAHGFDPSDYDGLHGWSVSDPGAFWSALWDFAGVIGEKGETAFALDDWARMTGSRFFPQARLNLAENLLRSDDDAVAVVETDESGGRRAMSHRQLRAEVARVAEGLRDAGVEPGDRVAAVLPNRIECLVTLLATAAVGGVWTSCSPDFGATAILDRIGQVRPKVLFAQTSTRYGGKSIDLRERIAGITERLPDLRQLVTIGDGTIRTQTPAKPYAEFGAQAELRFERIGFNDPVYILYTSGTTGAPKAIVHRVGGALLQQLKEHILHGDVRSGDRFLWYTNTAWMMYHWVVSSLGCGATLVLYDGAPILRDGERLDCSPLWRVTETERLTHLGISPKYLAALADQGFVPDERHDLSSLRWLLSAGSPVAPHQYDWVQRAVGSTVGFASISGGTEIMGCFLLGSPLHPVRRGHLTVRGLGMAVAVMDEDDRPVLGAPGDLVCTEPFPSMPLTFWGDGGTERYHRTYFADRPGVWTHGDHATLFADGTAVIHGRSDCTLNPGGVRIGTADIYGVCETFAEIEDCIVFGRPVAGDEEIVLCVKLAEETDLSADLAASIRNRIRAECSPRHVPAAIYAVSEIPYTLNGKRVEAAARAVATAQEVRNLASLANPECLEGYRALATRPGA